MFNVARRCLAEIAVDHLADALTPALELDFGRGSSAASRPRCNPVRLVAVRLGVQS